MPAVVMQNPNRRGNPNSGFRLLPEVGQGGKEPRPGQSHPGLALPPSPTRLGVSASPSSSSRWEKCHSNKGNPSAQEGD